MSKNSSKQEVMLPGNRKVITDFYVPQNVSKKITVVENTEKFKFTILIRLNATKILFKNVSFLHCVFEDCYFKNCVFDSCDFTGCKFIASNFHQTAFRGCDFRYTFFERSQIDDDILVSEAPKEENLRMRFARSLRMNFQQLGDAKAVNKAISLELEATSIYLYKSWQSGETYYKEKYLGFFRGVAQFLKWLEFWVLHFIWGNGESILKFLRTIIITLIAIAIFDTNTNSVPINIGFYWTSLLNSPAIFLGVLAPDHFETWVLTLITGARYVSFALLTTLLVKRFSRR